MSFDYKKKMSENKYSDTKLQEFKKIIETNLEKAEKQITDLQVMRKRRKEHFADANAGFNESSNHFQQQSKNKSSMRRLKSKAKNLQNALLRIKNGIYGIDLKTGELIDENRLKAMPTAVTGIRNKK